MPDMLKTVNKIISQPVREQGMKEGTVLKRRVKDVNGLSVIVISQDIPGEFIGTYTAFLPSDNFGTVWEKRVKQGKPVEAKIQFIKQRNGLLQWEVIEMKDVESCEELAADDEEIGIGY